MSDIELTVKIMEGERVVFTEESQPRQYLKLVASGEVDDSMLEALEDFVRRQRKRLESPTRPMIGLFAQLTPEQQAAALAYDGEELWSGGVSPPSQL